MIKVVIEENIFEWCLYVFVIIVLLFIFFFNWNLYWNIFFFMTIERIIVNIVIFFGGFSFCEKVFIDEIVILSFIINNNIVIIIVEIDFVLLWLYGWFLLGGCFVVCNLKSIVSEFIIFDVECMVFVNSVLLFLI